MSKATATDINDAGFKLEQFDSPSDWAAVDGYLARVLAKAARWVEQKLGAAAYAALVADTYVCDRVTDAERLYAIAELWRRRAAMKDAAAVAGLQEGAYLERREYLKHADEAMLAAETALADAQSALGVSTDIPGSGISVGVVEHGHFVSVAA